MPVNFAPFLWLLLTFFPLLVLQRTLHKEVLSLFFLLTHRIDIAVSIFSVLVFPGVLLHEASHYLVARLLGVKTGRFSIIPRTMENGKLQLGYVETAQVDWIRDALIGAAPLIIGGSSVAIISTKRLKLPELILGNWEGGFSLAESVLEGLIRQPDFWLWFYLALVISSTMLPSASDRRVWLPLGLMMAALVGLVFLMGAGPWLTENLAPAFNNILKAVSYVFGVSALFHLVLLPVVWILRKILAQLLGLDVVL